MLGLALTIEELDSVLDMLSLELVLGASSDLPRLFPMLSRDLWSRLDTEEMLVIIIEL